MYTSKKISLNGEWRMMWAENSDVMASPCELSSIGRLEKTDMPQAVASIPGNFETDLFRAGIIGDPYFGLNALNMQDLENKHLWYYRTFTIDNVDDNTFIVFEGLDTYAEIYLNGEHALSACNMHLQYEISARHLVDGENEIIVHIKPATIIAREKAIPAGATAMRYNAASLYTRKAAHMYGWDIFPRIISGGIWRPVNIVKKNPERFNEVFLYTENVEFQGNRAYVSIYFNLTISNDDIRKYRIAVKGSCGESVFSANHTFFHNSGKIDIAVENSKLWWPKNAGAPSLYDVVLELYCENSLLDVYATRFGIRTIRLERTSVTDTAGNGEFCFIVNERKIFVCGTNWVGADALHGNDMARMPALLGLLDDVGCNMVRVWGGSVYETDSFYDFCDEKGIMVWQDFMMGCAVYPADKEFEAMMETEVISIVKRLRNHASLVIWAGDNECDVYAFWSRLSRSPLHNAITRRLIPSLLSLHDFTRPFLPSSPYIDEQAYEKGALNITEDHLWGARDYYKSPYFKNSTAHFASEMGYHGCPSPDSVKRFISGDKLWPWNGNDEWLVHAASPELTGETPYKYRIELMAKQVRELFCEIPDNLDDFSIASQISQAEAFKYFIELFRTAKWRKTGIVWWNLVDAWPQFSDAVVDYYGVKKLAFAYIKRSQAPLCLMFGEPKDWALPLFVSNDTGKSMQIQYKVSDIESKTQLCASECFVEANSARKIWETPYSMSEKRMYLIEWSAFGEAFINHYLSGQPSFDLQKYIALAKQGGIMQR